MPSDLDLLIRDKYQGDSSLVTTDDRARLESGEPLAYVIGWIPFLGLRIELESRPLIPRPETEWWTDMLLTRLREAFEEGTISVLDLCAGSGAIGTSILKHIPTAEVSFAEIIPEHTRQIEQNIRVNEIDEHRAVVRTSNLFSAFPDGRWDVIAINPPYVPSVRTIEESVTAYEPSEALFSGPDGLDLIRRIALEAPAYIRSGGELWLEADIQNIEMAKQLLLDGGAEYAEILIDPYDRPRVVVAYYT